MEVLSVKFDILASRSAALGGNAEQLKTEAEPGEACGPVTLGKMVP